MEVLECSKVQNIVLLEEQGTESAAKWWLLAWSWVFAKWRPGHLPLPADAAIPGLHIHASTTRSRDVSHQAARGEKVDRAEDLNKAEVSAISRGLG